VSKSNLREKREEPLSLNLDLENGDAVCEIVSRENGLFIITKRKIICIRSPSDLDIGLEYNSASWQQSLYLPHGASDPLVARTVIQTAKMAEIFFSKNSEKYKILSDISWEVMNSLLSLRFVKDRLEKQVNTIMGIIEKDLETYTGGKSPKPLPVVEYYDIEFRSFANEVRRAINKISELFLPLIGRDFGMGRFHKAQEWSVQVRGKESLLAQMLDSDQRWIKAWVDIRVAIEHPKKDMFVETCNFFLESSRTVRLPTWRLIHPKHEMSRPQNLLIVLNTCIDNLLKFYEDIQIVLTDGHLPKAFKIVAEIIPEDKRNPDIPCRYNFYRVP
jgi:hypothetical protein